MDDRKLVMMANNIASFFGAYPEAEARKGVRDHIFAFWTPEMRRTLNERIATNLAGIAPLVLAALQEKGKGQEGSPPGSKPEHARVPHHLMLGE